MIDVTIQGLALESFGLTANQTIDGLGLNTFGFLWGCDSIWGPASPPVTTAWTGVLPSVVTTEVCTD